MAFIEIRELTKRFKISRKPPGLLGAAKHLVRPSYIEKTAIDHITLTIEAGESVAYVGPNGAGKSTTIKILTGITVPTSGDVSVAGLVPFRKRIENAHNIGVVFGQRTQLWWDIPVQESLRLLGDIYEIPVEKFRSNLSEMVEILELKTLLSIPARQLSLGQRMRCDLAASLLHSPQILFLDEPTIGLDVAVKKRIRQFIQRVNREQQTTILLTSHDLGDIEDLCNRLVMIDQGHIVFDGSMVDIQRRFGYKRVIHLMLSEEQPQALDLAVEGLSDVPTLSISQPEAYKLSVQFNANQITASMLVPRLLSMLPVNDLSIEEPSIEEIIRHLYEGTLQFAEVKAQHDHE